MSSKEMLRRAMLAKRKALSASYRRQASQQIEATFWQRLKEKSVQTLLFYMPIQGEVDLRSAMKKARKLGYRVALPRVISGRRLACYLVEREGQLQRGAYQILEPDPEQTRRLDPNEIELAVVPGVAFDQQCYRLGYGGGYYDRFLQSAPQIEAWGVAYEQQIVSTVYPKAHDQQLRMVITESQCLKPMANA